MALEQWQERCKAASSSERGEILAEALDDHLEGFDVSLKDVAVLLGTWWQTCDSYPGPLIFALTEQIYFAGDAFTVPAAKAADSLDYYQAIPDGELTVFRGCFEGVDETDLTWSTSKEKAQTWPFSSGGAGVEKRILIEGFIQKNDIIMAFNDRGQAEIVIESDCVTETNRMDLAPLEEEILQRIQAEK